MDDLITELDASIDELETKDFQLEVQADALSELESNIKKHQLWLRAKEQLHSNKPLSPVIFDRVKQYVSASKPSKQRQESYDLSTVALLLLTNEVFGPNTAEFKATFVLAKNLKNAPKTAEWTAAVEKPPV